MIVIKFLLTITVLISIITMLIYSVIYEKKEINTPEDVVKLTKFDKVIEVSKSICILALVLIILIGFI